MKGRAPTHGPKGEVADSLDEAKAAFQRAGTQGYRADDDDHAHPAPGVEQIVAAKRQAAAKISAG